MTPHDYLCGVLLSQSMRDQDLAMIRGLRDQIEARLRQHVGVTPRIYYGGSYAKGTMIREAFDLDIIVYYPHTEMATLSQIFAFTHRALTSSSYIVEPKTVALGSVQKLV